MACRHLQAKGADGMAKQQGPCAFSNSCIHPGARLRVPGTNIEYCPSHAQALRLPTRGVEMAASLRAPRSVGRRRGSWLMDYAGVVGGF